jgi:hypothetical protein
MRHEQSPKDAAESFRTLDGAHCYFGLDWYPVYAFARQRGYDLDDAGHLAQEFYICLIINDTSALRARRLASRHATPEESTRRSMPLYKALIALEGRLNQ